MSVADQIDQLDNPDQSDLVLRPPELVMNLSRLGSLHPYRLSFMRILMRRLAREKWRFETSLFELDEQGFGPVVYKIIAPNKIFSFVIFCQALDDDKRSDRVIADQWDMTATLIEGQVDEKTLKQLRDNVPLQENGRYSSRSIVLTRANKSSRNFETVVDALARGQQPSPEQISRVGYLYRTTAVYGSGKFGMADWNKVVSTYQDFAQPFAAEMLACFLIRHFSLEQAEYIAHQRQPDTAVALQPDIKRYFGIGNATGLGMAPYLIKHPLVVERWIAIREIALARVSQQNSPNGQTVTKLMKYVVKAGQHIDEITTDNDEQHRTNVTCVSELNAVLNFLHTANFKTWIEVIEYAKSHWSFETQEVINSLIIELYQEQTDDLENLMSVEEHYAIDPSQKLSELLATIEQRYAWALAIDIDDHDTDAVFWYRSEEKMEPRLGLKNVDVGEDKNMNMAIGIAIKNLHLQICDFLYAEPDCPVAHFVLMNSEYRSIIRRIQTMVNTHYGEIQANLHHKNVKPTDLMRCKLSFFGVSKFDPRSRLWVRNTMFQGAPLIEDLSNLIEDDWFFPTMPTGFCEKEIID